MGTETPGITASTFPSLTSGSDIAPGDDQLIDDEPEHDDRFVRQLFKRIASGKKPKKRWERDFEVDRSHDYVKGFQRAVEDEKDAQDEKKYQINKILASLKAKIPNIFYYYPYVRVRASRSREDTPEETVAQRAQLLQDTVNTIIRNPETRFKDECMLALKEAQWAFGVIEVGYEADWGENPYAEKPPLVENEDVERDLIDSDRLVDDEDVIAFVMKTLTDVPHKETFYCKYIPAKQFLVSSNDRSSVEAQDWVAYWEWMYLEDIKRSPSFKNKEDIKATGKSGEYSLDPDLTPSAEDREETPPDMVRVWKYWDMRERKRYVLAEGNDTVLKETEFTELPLFILRMEVMPGEWYPLPPIFSQLTEQDEFNDAREYMRVVRKGTRPRYLFDKNAFDPDELAKFETDEFHTFVAVNNGNLQAIAAVQQPSLAETAIRTLALAEQGFTEQSGVSQMDRLTRSAGGAPTATEVQALEQKGSVRESYEQQQVDDWLGAICRGILVTAVEKATLPMWIAMNSDPRSPAFQADATAIAAVWQQITSDQLEDAASAMNWDVTVDIESMSPVSEIQYANKLMQFMNLVASPGVGQLLSLSPTLLKLMLNMIGIRSETDQRSIMEALQKRDEMQRAMMEAQANANAPKQPGVAPMPGAASPQVPPTPGPPSPNEQGPAIPGPGGPQPPQPVAPPGRPS